MGLVYRARQLSLNRQVVVKMIHGGLLASKERVERFHYEARATSRLVHPHIVPIHAVGEIDGQHFFTTDYYAGGSLADRLSEFQVSRDGEGSGLQQQLNVANLIGKIAAAVHFAHSHGVIHRDLKPSNIFLDDQNEPFVGDFSLAKLAEEESGLTLSGAVLGTLSYMSPEQATGRVKELTTGTDVYGIGAVLYELLTGRAPFTGQTPTEILRKVSEEEVGSIRSLNPVVHPDLETICLRCLEKVPERRYRGAREVVDELERFQRGEPIYARRIRADERFVRWCQRRPLVASLAMLVLFVSIVRGVGMVLQRNQVIESNVKLKRSLLELDRRLVKALLSQGKPAEALGVLSRQLNEDAGDRLARLQARSILETYNFPLPTRPTLFFGRRAVKTVLSPDRQQIAVVLNQSTESGKQVGVNQRHRTPRIPGPQQSVHFWDFADGRLSSVELSHEGQIHDVSFSRDGGLLVTASWDGTAKIWNRRSGELIRSLSHEFPVFGARLSGDGSRLVTTTCDTMESGRVVVWDTGTWETVFSVEIPRAQVRGVRFSPNGKIFAVAREGNAIRESETGKLIAQIPEHRDFIHQVEFSPDGRRIVTGSENGLSFLIETGTGVAVFEPLLHGGAVYAVEFSPFGLRFATGSADGSARVWDSETGEPVTPPLRHDEAVIALAFSQDGQKLVTTSMDGSIGVWDSFSGEQLTRIPGVDGVPVGAFFHRDGEEVVSVTEAGACNVWDIRPGRSWPESTPLKPIVGSRRVATSDEAAYEVIPKTPRELMVWTHDMAQFETMSDPHGVPMTEIEHSPSATVLATVGADGSVKLWDSSRWELMHVLKHDEMVNRIRFDESGERLLTASDDGSIRLWDIARGEMILGPLSHGSRVVDVRFSTDETLIIGGCVDGDVMVWDVQSGNRRGAAIRHDVGVVLAGLLFDNETVVIVDEEGAVCLKELRTGLGMTEPIRVIGEADRMQVSPSEWEIELAPPFRSVTSQDRHLRIRFDVSHEPASESFLQLLDLVSQSDRASVDRLAALRGNGLKDDLGGHGDLFVEWFLSDRERRPVSLGAELRVRDFLSMCLKERARDEKLVPSRHFGAAAPYVLHWRSRDAKAYLNMARHAGGQGGTKARTAYYVSRHGALLEPGDPEAWFVRATLAVNQGRFQEAIDVCDHGLALDPVRGPFIRLKKKAQRELRKQTTQTSHVSKFSRDSIESLMQNQSSPKETEPRLEIRQSDVLQILPVPRVDVVNERGTGKMSARVAPPVIGLPEMGNHALAFDGWDDYVVIDDVGVGRSDFTMEAWILPVRPAAGYIQYLLTNRTNNKGRDGHWFIFGLLHDGRLGLYLAEGDTGTVANLSGNTVLPSRWTHVAVVREAEEIRFYLDGVLDGQFGSVAIRDLNAGKGGRIGGWPDLARCYFEGRIDEMRVWRGARSAVSIREGMGRRPLDDEWENLLAYFPFDQGIADGGNAGVNQLIDRASNGAVGILRLFALAPRSVEEPASNWVAGVPQLGNPVQVSNDFNGSWNASDEYPVGKTSVTWALTDSAGSSVQAVTEVVVE